MSRKFTAARRNAFLKALGETGNQTLSAERAKVSRSWVCLHRATDPAFDGACREAIAAAKEKLRWAPDQVRGDGRSNRPPVGWGFLDGAELVVKGSGGAGGGRRVQIARARIGQWTPRTEARFLAALAATCNVKASCAEVGMSHGSAYAHRTRWAAFATRWDAAIETGYARIEMALVEHGCNLFSGIELPPEGPIGRMSVEQAIHLLHMHKHAARGIGKEPGVGWRRPKTLDEVKDSILRKLDALDRRRAMDAAERAAQERVEREWALRRSSG